MIAYIFPTRNRPECLARTLSALAALPHHNAEVIVIDNASNPPATTPRKLANGLPITLLARPHNEGAAARNAGAQATDPSSTWLIMLDDDSHPINLNFLDALREQPNEVAAISAEIFLPTRHSALGTQHSSPREAGGLPEIPIGCGVAYRREAFLSAHIHTTAGYDPRFGFYAEEYDLAARLIRSGHRIVMDRRFQVLHEKTPAGRSMDTILRRLIRNNAWVMARYAPQSCRTTELRRIITRYARIALKEHATLGYATGLAQFACTLHAQQRTPLNPKEWDRFTGKSACRRALLQSWSTRRFTSATIVAPGKNEHIVRECLQEMGVRITPDEHTAEALIIGTLSPGPMLDAAEAFTNDHRIVIPWDTGTAPALATPSATARQAA